MIRSVVLVDASRSDQGPVVGRSGLYIEHLKQMRTYLTVKIDDVVRAIWEHLGSSGGHFGGFLADLNISDQLVGDILYCPNVGY